MTLVEFLAPLKASTHQDRVLGVLYFKERYEEHAALTVEQIRDGLKAARAKAWAKVNVADVLNKGGHYVDTPGVQGKRRLWRLTDSGKRHVRELLNLPEADVEVEHDVGTLETVATKVPDPEVKDYVEEALKCLRVGALRACVVFLWSGAARVLHNQLFKSGATAVTAAIQKHDPKARNISRVDDFAYVKDAVTLLAARDMGLLDKNQKDALGEALDLRNRCGHPGKYKPGVKKVSGFIEDVVSIVFS